MKTMIKLTVVAVLALLLAGCVTKPKNRSNLQLPPVEYAEP